MTDIESHTALFNGLGTSDRTWTILPGGDRAAFLESPREIFLQALTGFTVRVSQR